MALDKQFETATQNAVKKIFDTLITLPMSLINEADDIPTPKELVGTIMLMGEISGSISLYMTQALAMKLTSQLIQQPITEMGAYVYASVGELTNMIVGNIKTHLSTDEKDAFEIGLPMVMTGQVGEGYRSPKATYVRMVFRVDDQNMVVAGLVRHDAD